MRLTLFILRRALSEIRQAKQRALLMVACIAIGIAAISAVRIYTDSISSYYNSNVKALNGGDICMDGDPSISKAQRSFLANGSRAGRFMFTEVRISQEYLYMKRDASKGMMIQLTGVVDPASYPLYGKLEISRKTGSINGRKALEKGEILLSSSTMSSLDAHIGDILILGDKEYRIGGVLTPDSAMDSMDIGFVGKAVVKETAAEGSAASRGGVRFYIKTNNPKDINALTSELTKLCSPVTPHGGHKQHLVRTYKETQKEISKGGDNLGNLLMVAGLASLLLGGLGIYTTTNMMISQRMRDIAIIKCVGGKTSQVLAIFGVQVLILSIAGIALGLAAGTALSTLIPLVVQSLMPIKPEVSISWSIILKVGFLGILVTILFAVLPLLNIGRIRPLLLYRDEVPKDLYKRSWLVSAGLVLLMTALFGLGISVVIGSLKIGLGLAYGILAFIGTLYWPVNLTVKLFCKLPAGRSVAAKLGLRSLERQGGKVVSSVLAIAVGVGAIILVTLVQDNVIRTVNDSLETAKAFNVMAGGAPRSAIADVNKMISRSRYVAEHTSIVMLNGSFSAKNGIPVKRAKSGAGYNSLSNASLTAVDPSNKAIKKRVVAGRWLSSREKGPADLVLDKEFARRLNLRIGDILQFDHMTVAQTRHIPFKVVGIFTNEDSGGLIKFDFTSSMLINVNKLSSQGLGNTGNEMLLIKTKAGIKGALVTSQIRHAFPSIRMVIDIGQILDIFIGIIETATRFVQFLGLFSMASGGIILAGIIILTKYRRRKDIAIIRCIGGRTMTVLLANLFEYAVIGFLAGGLGITTSNAITATIMKYVVKAPFRFDLPLFAATVVLTMIFTSVIGMLSVVDIVNEKPLKVLRYE